MHDSPQAPSEEPAAAGGQKIGRWQFSLRGLMLFVLLAAMGMALFTTGWQLLRARKELAEYRREYGILNVDNPAMPAPLPAGRPNRANGDGKCISRRAGMMSAMPPPAFEGTDSRNRSAGSLATSPATRTSRLSFSETRKAASGFARFYAGGASVSRDVSDAVVNPPALSTSGVQWNQEPAIVSPQTPLVLLQRQIGTRQKDGSIGMSNLERYRRPYALDPTRGRADRLRHEMW